MMSPLALIVVCFFFFQKAVVADRLVYIKTMFDFILCCDGRHNQFYFFRFTLFETKCIISHFRLYNYGSPAEVVIQRYCLLYPSMYIPLKLRFSAGWYFTMASGHRDAGSRVWLIWRNRLTASVRWGEGIQAGACYWCGGCRIVSGPTDHTE